MKLKLKKTTRTGKILNPRGIKLAKRSRTVTKVEVVKARVVAVRPAKRPALPGKGAVLVALKKKERAAELAKLAAKTAIRPAMTVSTAAKPAPGGNIVPLPEHFDPENEEPTQEALAKEAEVKPVT